MKSDTDLTKPKGKEKNSSLHQTKARYLQVIQDLTKDHQSVQQKNVNNSNSNTKPVSKSCSSVDLYNGNNTSAVEETPEEIKQYVKQFKQEVEEKFKKSESNKHYAFPRNNNADKKRSTNIDSDASIESLEKVTRYDLNSQNITKKYASNKSHSMYSLEL